jgi:hypothetical protein
MITCCSGYRRRRERRPRPFMKGVYAFLVWDKGAEFKINIIDHENAAG